MSYLATRSKRLTLYAIIALSAPLTLAIEVALRAALLPPELAELREWFAPTLRPWAWVAAGATVVISAGAIWLTRGFVERSLASPPETPLARRHDRVLDALMTVTSIPQVPSILAAALVMLGADLLPALLSMLVSTAAIGAQGWQVERALTAPCPGVGPGGGV